MKAPQLNEGSLYFGGPTCEFTKDKTLLEEYFTVRKKLYFQGGEKFRGTLGQGNQDIFDDGDHPLSHIMVIKLGDKCIGGARIVVKQPHSTMRLPSESDNFSFEKSLPDLKLSHLKYGELSRLALLPEYSHYICEVYDALRIKAIELNLQFMVGTATKARTIIYRRIASNYASQMTIREDVTIPDEGKYEDVEMYLAVLDLRPEYSGLEWNHNIYTKIAHNDTSAIDNLKLTV